MIERKFVAEQLKEFQIQEYISETLKNVGHSHTKVMRTPLGEKIIIFASRPGLIVGRKGENIKSLTATLKKKFGLENPQIEISEVANPNLDAQIVAERIASTLERFGSQKFKAVGHKTLADVMAAGALGIEISISGKVPSARAKSWRFYQGYLKKSGQTAITDIKKAVAAAQLKSGTVGIKVSIMLPDTNLPDKVLLKSGDVSAQHPDAAPHAQPEEKKDVPKRKVQSRRQSRATSEKTEGSTRPKRQRRKTTEQSTTTNSTPEKKEDATHDTEKDGNNHVEESTGGSES